MNEFLESPRFPGCPSFGFTAKPRYREAITELAGGGESRYRLWSRPLYDIDITVGPRMEDEIQEILEHFHAVGGPDCAFRVKNYIDWKSCRVGVTPTPLDQPIAEKFETSSSGDYQLVKDYTSGARTQRREIYKPVAGTIRIANEAGEEQPASRWSLDTTTGVLLIGGTFVGTPTTWGGEFDEPMRYESESIPFEIVNKAIQSVTFTLKGLRKSDLGF